MFKNQFFRRLFHQNVEDIDQVKLVYILSLVVGLLSALAAGILKNAIHYTHQLLTGGITWESGGYLYLAYPLIGMGITMLFVRYIVRDNIGHGISRILYAISRRKSQIRKHNMWTSLVASTVTIGFGGSVGAEAPIVLTGSSIGSAIGTFFKLNYRNITLLIGCGAAGAIAGIFKAPIAGIVFTLEILMLDLTLSSIVPLLISSVTAATVSYFLMGDKVLLTFEVTEPFNIANIPWYLILGVVSGLVSFYFSKMTLFLEGQYERIRNIYIRLAAGGIVVGGLIYLFPPFYGEGYDTIMKLLQGDVGTVYGNSLFSRLSDTFPVMILFMSGLVLLKVFASSSTNGAGGVGGIFAPTLFMGGVTLDEVREIMFNHELHDKIRMRDLMAIPPSYIDKKENIETVMETFRKTGAWNLPVLDGGYYVGFISKSRIYTTYRELLIQFSEE
jgi:CIC family chloride channel protein